MLGLPTFRGLVLHPDGVRKPQSSHHFDAQSLTNVWIGEGFVILWHPELRRTLGENTYGIQATTVFSPSKTGTAIAVLAIPLPPDRI